MNEEKKSRFRIKWADREVEYYGDEAKAAYDDLIAHVKSIPIGVMTPPIPGAPPAPPTSAPPPPSAKGRELELISNDSRIPLEQLGQLIEFRTVKDFNEPVPFLPRHPENEDATLLISYALQVGLQKSQIEVSYLKKILEGPNGYPLPGRTLGLILLNFRNRKWTITSQTKGRYKPFSLSSDGGLEAARELLRRPPSS
jgi:hypothetical protein